MVELVIGADGVAVMEITELFVPKGGKGCIHGFYLLLSGYQAETERISFILCYIFPSPLHLPPLSLFSPLELYDGCQKNGISQTMGSDVSFPSSFVPCKIYFPRCMRFTSEGWGALGGFIMRLEIPANGWKYTN